MMKGQSVLHCVVCKKTQKNVGSTMATPTSFRVENPPHDLFLAHEKSDE